jgi:tetratricopeptide (TPR) repeat protein
MCLPCHVLLFNLRNLLAIALLTVFFIIAGFGLVCASQLFNAVLKAVQDQCHYWAGRGDCLQALGQYEDAYHDYSAAVRISPSRSVLNLSFLPYFSQ